jgi:glycosyltransferase involved in cell wall biosynthesis
MNRLPLSSCFCSGNLTFPEADHVAGSSLSVAVVDPLSFSPAYNYSLCDALACAGCRVTLAQGGMPRPHLTRADTFELWSKFHRASQSSAPRKVVRRLLERVRQLRAGNQPRAVASAQPGAGAAEPVPRSVRKLITFSDHFFGMRQFASEFEIERPDIIHFQWLALPIIDRFYLSRLEKIAPLVLTLHNTTLFHGSPTSRLQGLGFSSVFRYFSAVIVHTEFSKNKVAELAWCRPEKIHVVPHGVLECHHLPTSDKTTSQEEEEQTILFFGAVRSYKGVDLLIQAFARLPAVLKASTRLVVAGQPGMDASELHRLAESLGVDHRIAWHLRFIRDEEIPELFRKASLVALPYRDIDQSGVLMTAIAFEKPVVASRIGGIPEVIQDGVHGYLVEVGDVNGLATALGKLLLDRDRREGMQKAVALLRSGPLAWDSCAKRTIGLYDQVLHSAADT